MCVPIMAQDKVYLRAQYIKNQQLRTAYGAWRVVRAAGRQVELEPYYRDALRSATLKDQTGQYTKPFNMDPGKIVVPAAATWTV